jgi:glycogen debranching enzyme
MAFIAGKLGRPDDQKEFQARADALARAVNTILWNEQDGFYYDRNEKTGEQIRVKSVVGFLPLWAGIATPERAKRLIQEHLTNTNEFWLKYPVATYAATEPDYYQGRRHGECNWQGTSWIPTDYMVMHGLLRYGFKDAARELASRTFKMALDENPTTREFYDADTGKGNGMNPFWGWSSLAYVMPLEVELGYDPTEIQTKIQPWLARNLEVKGPQQ